MLTDHASYSTWHAIRSRMKSVLPYSLEVVPSVVDCKDRAPPHAFVETVPAAFWIEQFQISAPAPILCLHCPYYIGDAETFLFPLSSSSHQHQQH
jgi:hypothetical protein